VDAAFGQRRKMLRQSLSALLDDPTARLQAADVAPTARGEELGVHEFLRIARG
jgi:16S rRNA (adenine1518-N6/adenine1519-N6)-dimethyltransferase